MKLSARALGAVLVLTTWASACETRRSRPEGQAAIAQGEAALISDQLHNGGTNGFIFLPPMVAPPPSFGDIVRGVPATVRIDETNALGVTLRTLATFAAKTGPRGEHMRWHEEHGQCDADDDDNDGDDHAYYYARWKTDDANLSLTAHYRVRVLVPAKGGGTRELGFSDLYLVRNEAQFKGVDRQNFTPLINGKTLRIKFRIDWPAVDQDHDGIFDWNDDCPTVYNPDQKDSLHNGVGDACRCLTVTCTALDSCHTAGACQPTTGTCTNPSAADGTSCTIANANASCTGGVCKLNSCRSGYGDCNNNPADGCETSVTTTSNCGSCGNACGAGPNSTAVCSGGSCGLACATGYADCDGRASTGCEQNVSTDFNNCGSCGHVCASHEACVASACTAASCQAGWGDCNGNSADGCEASLNTDVSNCGRCGLACVFANAGAQCSAGTCTIGACSSGYADCNHDSSDGCEKNLSSDVNNCGACGTTCTLAHASPACSGGACAVASCNSGYANCDGLAANGCEINLQGDVSNCGSCGNACVVPNASPACRAGGCAIGACNAGWVDCDHSAGNGCEINVESDVNNCGACGQACAFGPNSSPTCSSGQCAIACAPGFADCDGNPANGCEVNTTLDNGNCGACGTVCQNHETCQSSACSTAVCQAGYADCNGDPSDGCEAVPATDANNCGACGTVCMFTHAFAACTAGSCGFSVCETGFADCNGIQADGCEVDLGTPFNCGGCGNVCAIANASPVCTSGACTIASCNPGFADCDGNPQNGCEISTSADVANCGACGAACAAAANAIAGCSGGSCIMTGCLAGFADCDHQAADGCEVALNTDTANCGACGSTCNLPHATAACAQGACAIASCNPGFADCDGNVANGCETSLTDDVNNCGACHSACSVANGTAACVAGACAIAACNAGYTDCDHQAGDGCEVNTAADLTNCGACGLTCQFPNGSPICQNGACGGTSCNPGYADCDGNPANGCEVALTTDASNCGACGSVCAEANATAACVQGACAVGSCNAGFADCDGLASDGCEASTSNDAFNCGACGNACRFANGVAACTGGACALTGCTAGFGNCDGNAANGCEATLATDANNCGACGNVCAMPNATSLCAGGSCAVASCNAGYGDCDSNVPNGCETNFATDVNNCGACNHACGAGASCQSGACVYPSKRVFVSSTSFSGNLGGALGADAKCQAVANSAGLGGSWKAWISDDTIDVRTRFVHNAGPYVLVDGTRIADSWTALTVTGPSPGSTQVLLHAINLTETGAPATVNCYPFSSACGPWTDTNRDGTEKHAGLGNCANWTSTGSGYWISGLITATDARWTVGASAITCNGRFPLYCFEQ